MLLTAPVDVLLQRVRTRATNDYGKHPAESARIRSDVDAVEPLLRRGATVEVDTRRPLREVVDLVEASA